MAEADVRPQQERRSDDLLRAGGRPWPQTREGRIVIIGLLLLIAAVIFGVSSHSPIIISTPIARSFSGKA
jgi:hypothetical protein